MDPLKNNACLKEVIQNAVDTAVKAIRHHNKRRTGSQRSSSDLARAVAIEAGSTRYPGVELPVPWWLLSPEFAMYHGVAAEVDGYHDASKKFGEVTGGRQAHLMEAGGRLNERISTLKVERMQRQQCVRSSRKRYQGLGLPIYQESYNFHRNSLYEVLARLQWCRNERDRLADELNELSGPDPVEMSKQMTAAMEQHREGALRAEKAAMEADIYDMSSDDEGSDDGHSCSATRPSKMPRLC